MKQFILKNPPDKNGQIKLKGDDYRYLVKVRRLAPGEFFPALLPDGNAVSVKVCSVDKNSLSCLVTESGAGTKGPLFSVQTSLPLPSIPVLLFQALPKGDKMDLIVRQAAECGVTKIVPFVSEFSAVKNNGIKRSGIVRPAVGGQKFSRWERIIREARQQSGSAAETAVLEPMSFDGILTYWEQKKTETPGALGLLFHHLPLANETLHSYLCKSGGKPGLPEAVVLTVGPEGGFSGNEVKKFLAAGFRLFTFAGAVLRVETAALYAVAAVQIILSERDSWKTK